MVKNKTAAEHAEGNRVWKVLTVAEDAHRESSTKENREAFRAALAHWQSLWPYDDGLPRNS